MSKIRAYAIEAPSRQTIHKYQKLVEANIRMVLIVN